eukprot:TRINITY_DN22517_c0_g1_i1.p1 TRINITY_DN22517_c0_g1~~TRINITY_DN22517_c0_g1_i1.p1  ORF type:complete len:600 (-),score=202.12 TRINITY_DN22517_c0_g1_i1:12-1589(-)
MIQDTFDPECAIGACPQIGSDGQKTYAFGKFREEVEGDAKDNAQLDFSAAIYTDRVPFYCIPIPALSPFAKGSDTTGNKIDADEPTESHQQKRKERDVEMVEETDASTPKKKIEEASEGLIEKLNPSSYFESLDVASFPIKSEMGLACLIRAHHNTDAYRLNQIHDFVGILSRTPQHTDFAIEIDELEIDDAPIPPNSLLPRLQLLFSRPLQPLDFILSKNEPNPVSSMDPQKVSQIRADLIQEISNRIGNDTLAAEYILLNLLSKIQARKGSILLGNLSVNIMGNSQENSRKIVESLNSFFSQILPKFHRVTITIEKLNEISMIPAKNYSKNRLASGELQLPEGTHLLLDSTRLEPGKLNEIGTKNIEAICHMIGSQEVLYDFTYHPLHFPVNFPVTVVSHGKSLFTPHCSLSVPTVPTTSTFNSTQLEDSTYKIYRLYLALFSNLEYSIEDQLAVTLQDSFVEARKSERNIRRDDFQLWLTLARLESLSRGVTSLTGEIWETTLKTEFARLERMENFLKEKSN